MITGIIASMRPVVISGPPGSAFPEIKSIQVVPSVGATASISATFSASAGDLVLLILAQRMSITGSTPSLSSGGWTLINGAGVQASSVLSNFFWQKTVTVGETITVTHTPTQSIPACLTVVVIRAGTHSGQVEVANVTAGSGLPNPPSLSPAWGIARTLWLASASRSTDVTFSAFPLPDNKLSGKTGSVTATCVAAICSQNLEAASLDPGTFTVSSGTHIASTIAIRPTVA